MSCVVELLRSWSHPRAIVLTAIAIGTAGCSAETLRFNDNPFSSQSAPSEVTGSVPARTAPVGRVESNALPPPAASRPVTTATAAPAPHYETAGGGRGLASYHPAPSSGPEVTGSVQSPPPPARAPAPASQWSWDGGTAVTVGRGETVDSIAHRHGVPACGNPAGQQPQRRPSDLSRPAPGDPALQSGRRAARLAPAGRTRR